MIEFTNLLNYGALGAMVLYLMYMNQALTKRENAIEDRLFNELEKNTNALMKFNKIIEENE